jgi:hypothetical protein
MIAGAKQMPSNGKEIANGTVDRQEPGAEVSHQPTRLREAQMRRFKSVAQAQRPGRVPCRLVTDRLGSYRAAHLRSRTRAPAIPGIARLGRRLMDRKDMNDCSLLNTRR